MASIGSVTLSKMACNKTNLINHQLSGLNKSKVPMAGVDRVTVKIQEKLEEEERPLARILLSCGEGWQH